MGIKIKLQPLLDELGITANALARESKIRPNTIMDMCKNKTKRIEFPTFNAIMETLIQMSDRPLTITDILEYEPESEEK